MWIPHRFCALSLGVLLFAPAAEAVRAKDIATFYGVRTNQVTGAGLVVGLNRTGDSRRNAASIRALANRLQGLGVSLDTQDIIARNVALVMVSGILDADARTGSQLDITVASTGDSSSLAGGFLLMTPLMGPDGNIYAVGSGPLTIGGFSASAAGNSSMKNIPTIGRVSGGGMVEREVPSAVDYQSITQIDYILRDPDFTTADRMAQAINLAFNEKIALAVSSSTITLSIPEEFFGKFPMFASKVESVDVAIDAPARVIISERTGTVVMGADVTVSAVAVAHGGLSIEVRRRNEVSQPSALSGGSTAIVSNTELIAKEEDGQLVLVEGVSIGDLVSALNKMGVKPRDLIIILQAIQSAGALHAEIVPL